MKDKDVFSGYDYSVVQNDYFLFNNQLPSGPIQLLLNKERVRIAYLDYDNRIRVRLAPFNTEKLQITYFSVPGNGEYWHLLQAVALFNVLNAKLTVYCSGDCIAAASTYANRHIRFQDLADLHPDIVVETHVIVTFSLGALYFMRQGVPVVIAGPHGLGGFVTPDNFAYMDREGFLGRPGGGSWEPIPPAVFLEEVISVRYFSGLGDMLEKVRILAEQLPYIPSSAIPGLKAALEAHLAKLGDEKEKWALVPSLASNLLFIRKNDQVHISRRQLNDTIASIDDPSFFTFIDGVNNFEQVYALSEMEESDFWELADALIRQKIILI